MGFKDPSLLALQGGRFVKWLIQLRPESGCLQSALGNNLVPYFSTRARPVDLFHPPTTLRSTFLEAIARDTSQVSAGS
jgi:hypothetical protein